MAGLVFPARQQLQYFDDQRLVGDVFVVAFEYQSLQTLAQFFGNDVVAQFRRALQLIFFCCYINQLRSALWNER